MEIKFSKYQGTGNDFILIDNRLLQFPKNDTKLVKQLCNRKFGIGADGLILLEKHSSADFTMVYFNADGNISSMCGNGGRCITDFAKNLGIIEKATTFEAVDGIHDAMIENGMVSLKMNDVVNISEEEEYTFLDTGSPHHVQLVDNLTALDVFQEGREIRNYKYGNAGANVNFVEAKPDGTFGVRTYERGVEDETLSCGTGVTAVAIAMHARGVTNVEKVTLEQPGGLLQVRFKKTTNGYEDVYLIGPATKVFTGTINI